MAEGKKFSGDARYEKKLGAAGNRFHLREANQNASTAAPLTLEADESFPGRDSAKAAIDKVASQMNGMTKGTYDVVAAVDKAANAGDWSAAKTSATMSLLNLRADQGHDKELHEDATAIYAENNETQEFEEMPPSWYTALTCAEETATALAHRHLIGKIVGWDQSAYDALTRAWRSAVGPIHPDDSDRIPESWIRRPVTNMEKALSQTQAIQDYDEAAARRRF